MMITLLVTRRSRVLFQQGEIDGVRLNGITIHLKQDIACVLPYGVLAACVFLYAIFYFLPYKYVSFLYRILVACVFLYVVFLFLAL
jgi:hypothetical protein